MHPDLLNNSHFLRYYKQWQDDPGSIVFAPIAEFFLNYGMLNDAYNICREGLKKHPTLVSGLIVMAKIHLRRGNYEEAGEELRKALSVVPTNGTALTLLSQVEETIRMEHEKDENIETNYPIQAAGTEEKELVREQQEVKPVSPTWNTVTMAEIYVKQGHQEQAKEIYKSILAADPNNEAARVGMASLTS